MNKNRMMELLNGVINHIAAANDTEDQIRELFLIGFSKEELINYFGYREADFEGIDETYFEDDDWDDD